MSAYDFRRMTLCHVTVTTFIPLLLTVVFNCESLSIGFPQDWSSDWPISTSNVEHVGEGLRHTNGCQFPEHWMGNWFQKGVQDPIRIINGTLSNKGDCRDSDGDKFLIESWNEKCYRCVVMHEKHENVLQYKESYCSPINQFQSLGLLCEEINGDALLFSMFRLGSAPVGCPFSGPFTFTYRRDSGECANPVSSIDSCTDDSRLLFRFQACANVMSSESRENPFFSLASNSESGECPLVGIYTTEGSNSLLIHVDTPDLDTLSCSHDSILASGCSAVDQLELLEECASERRVTKFQCRGSWEENGTYYLIATAKETRKHYCITYTEKDKVLHFSGSTETCLRNIGIENFVVFNVTNSGLCMDTNGATRHPDLTSWISSLIFFLILTLTSKCGSR
ncbi:uncharacterized protein LOC111626215 [Centruroides sculpturatus]|uniref:uncharacterized protein LOC111626215 n=1 Tax=Centruroides sculpturatus TaxID=218467 RepID=UPI000C6D3332|nr:uncharacterized protein LOC111626215 [Centruroides sculpturatus]